jgi:hypothetical protein
MMMMMMMTIMRSLAVVLTVSLLVRTSLGTNSTSFTCMGYSAQDTNNTVAAYCTCSIYVCPGDVLTISGCAQCKNDNQYIRLSDSAGYQLTYDDGTNSPCAPCAQITNYAPPITYCQYLILYEGCVGDDSCNGEFVVTTTSPSAAYAEQAAAALRVNKNRAIMSMDSMGMFHSVSKATFKEVQGHFTHRSQMDSESIQAASTTTTPECSYVMDLGALGAILAVGTMIAMVIALICGCACIAALIFLCVFPCISVNHRRSPPLPPQFNENVSCPPVNVQGIPPTQLVYYGQQPDGTPVYIMQPTVTAAPAECTAPVDPYTVYTSEVKAQYY